MFFPELFYIFAAKNLVKTSLVPLLTIPTRVGESGVEIRTEHRLIPFP